MAFQQFPLSYTPALSTITLAQLINSDTDYDETAHGEAGVAHNTSDFNTYFKITTTSLDGGYSWVMYTAAGTGIDEVILPPSDGSYTDTFNVPMDGSGVYTSIIIAVPTWDNSVTYLVASDHHVYYNGAIYKCLQNALNKNPATETAYWEEVEDDDINEKYRAEANIAYVIPLEADYAAINIDILSEGVTVFRKDLLANLDFQKASKLWMMLQVIDNLSGRNLWTNCDEIIAHAKVLTGE